MRIIMISSKKIVTLSAIAMIGVVFLAEPYMIAHAENTSNNQMQNCGQNFEQDYAALVQSGENLFSPNPSEGYAVSNFLGSATDTELINFERLLQIVNDESDTHNLDYNKIIYLNTLAPAAIKQALKTVVPVQIRNCQRILETNWEKLKIQLSKKVIWLN